MKLAIAMLATTAIFGATCAAQAQERGSKATPGHEMQEHGSVPGHPGASGYAPGHLKKKEGTTGMGRDGDRDRDDRRGARSDRDRDDRVNPRTTGSGGDRDDRSR